MFEKITKTMIVVFSCLAIYSFIQAGISIKNKDHPFFILAWLFQATMPTACIVVLCKD